MVGKVVCSGLLVAFLGGALAACGGGGSTTVVERGVAEEASVTDKAENQANSTYLSSPALQRKFVKPTNYPFSADGDLVGAELQWEDWGTPVATAEGSLEERRYPSNARVIYDGAVIASGLERCKGRSYYTEVEAELPANAAFQPEGQPFQLTTPCRSTEAIETEEGEGEEPAPKAVAASSPPSIGFETPSGNIECALSAADVHCEILRKRYTPYVPKPASCPLDYGHRLSVERFGPAEFDCYGDSMAEVGEGRVLGYGREIRRGHLRCVSRESGVTCKNLAGAGFFLSVDRAQLY